MIQDGTWNEFQVPSIKEWQRQHELDEHGGKDVPVEVDPNSMYG